MRRGRCAHHAGGDLGVLLANRADHVGGRQVVAGQLGRVEPDAHRVVARAEAQHRAHARDAQQLVAHIQRAVVAQVERVAGVVRAHEVDHHREVGAALLGRHADLADDVGQARQRAVDAVLHRGLGGLGMGADLERDGQGHAAVAGGLALEIQHVLESVDLLLQRRGHRLGDHARVGAGILRAHDHLGRRDLGVFRDRQQRDGQRADQEDEERQHGREARPVDEKA
mmetsp:Transcript_9838/g.18716  ORF Transcript_9838/g.18716 Transcript_9838/m.18716 type:complete len:226 (+) Transcript_9838:875-1552(+)